MLGVGGKLMDYLSGKQISSAYNEKKEKNIKNRLKLKLTFSEFCNTVMAILNPDERALLNDKILSPEIIAVMKDKELIECINAFFKNNLNISETSRNAFLHRNTLLYRIEKIYKLTGLNIRNFEDAMSFRILTLIYEKTQKGLGK